MSENKKRYTIHLPVSLMEKAKKFARKTGRTYSGLVEVSLRDKINRDEEE